MSNTMNGALARHVEDYLRLRRSLGFKLQREGVILPRFAAYLEAAGAATVTTELAIAWAGQPVGVHPVSWRHRLGAVRGFAAYLRTIDPATEIPSPDVFPGQGNAPSRTSTPTTRSPACSRQPGPCGRCCAPPPTKPSSG